MEKHVLKHSPGAVGAFTVGCCYSSRRATLCGWRAEIAGFFYFAISGATLSASSLEWLGQQDAPKFPGHIFAGCQLCGQQVLFGHICADWQADAGQAVIFGHTAHLCLAAKVFPYCPLLKSERK